MTAGLAVVLTLLAAYAMLNGYRQYQLVGRVAAAATDADAYQLAAYRASDEIIQLQSALREPHGYAFNRLEKANADTSGAMAFMASADHEHSARAAALVAEHATLWPAIERYRNQLRQDDITGAARTLKQDIDPSYAIIMSGLLAEQNAHTRDYDEQQARAEAEGRKAMLTGGAAMLLGLLVFVLLAFSVRAHRRQVEAIAATDALTGLLNRTAFTARLEASLYRRPTVLVVNVDGFRDVNDQLGQRVGDLLLTGMGNRLAGSVREDDVVARLGGDEFAVLLRDSHPEVGEAIAERLTAAFQNPFVIDDVTLDLEVSIGAATVRPGEDAATVLRHADSAMHNAKQDRVGFRRFRPDHRQDAAARLTLLGDLRRALDDPDQLTLHYQPKIDVASGTMIGVEALARWSHPVRGAISPVEFIPVLETTGLMHRFTDRMLLLALRQTRQWLDSGHRVPVAVNVSTRSLLDTSFPDRVSALLEETGVPGALLCIEVTEHTVMSDPTTSIDALSRVRALGVKTSIDDYGTGYSSMTYLKLLPVDELKIDRSFVMDMVGDRSSQALVASTVELGHSLGLTVVAEGVEEQEMVTALQAIGCDSAQGYLFAPPLPASELTARLSGSPASV